MSYQPKVYRKQGGDELVVASGGTVTFESGGTFALESGAVFSMPVQSLGTSQTGTDLIFGVNAVTASTTTPRYTLPVPAAGKTCIVGFTATPTSGAGDAAEIITSSSNVSLTSSGDRYITLGTTAQTAHLVGVSATKWMMLGGSPLSPGTATTS